jgi:signal transduction histidine kinase
MNFKTIYGKKLSGVFSVLLAVCMFFSFTAAAQSTATDANSKDEPAYGNDHVANSNLPVLIISSYNPETSSVTNTLLTCKQIIDSLKIKNPLVIENMNCKNFGEVFEYQKRFDRILNKYTGADGNLAVSAVVLLGQEAWATYLSQTSDKIKRVPIVCSMISSNSIPLPAAGTNLATWAPDPIYLTDLKKRDNVLSGVIYNYDIERNIELIKLLYPNATNFALVTDNTFGGVAMQAHVKKVFESHGDLHLILLDGRNKDVLEMENAISSLTPSNSVMMLGTWRVDKNESYYLPTAVYTLVAANKKIPVFSLSSIGMGQWALGGCFPKYRNQGRDIAENLIKVLNGSYSEPGIYFDHIPNTVQYDAQAFAKYNLDKRIVGSGAKFINEVNYLPERYRKWVDLIAVALAVFLIAFIFILTLLYKTEKLNTSLQVSHRDNKLILDNIGEGLIFIDIDHNIIWENCSTIKGMEDFAEWRIGTKCYDLKKRNIKCDTNCPILTHSFDGSHTSREIIHKEARTYQMYYNSIYNPDSKEYLGTVIRVEDVTEREAQTAELRLAKSAAESADKMKSQFIANVSHEIRTPLNAINGFAELLMDEDITPDDKKMYKSIIQSNTKQLLNLVNDILSLSKIEAGTLDFVSEDVDLNELVSAFYGEFSLDAKAKTGRFVDKNIELQLDIPKETCKMISDPARLRELFTNLMVNAVKFTNQGHIKIGFTEREKDVRCFVEDTGRGIPDDQKQKIFDRFVKLDNYVEGTGLGLSICMQIVKHYNGQMGVDSEVGKGSTFWFILPKQ